MDLNCIHGRVFNLFCNIVPNASIVLKYLNKNIAIKTTSNSKGYYVLKNVDINSQFIICVCDNKGNLGKTPILELTSSQLKLDLTINMFKNYSVVAGDVLDAKSLEPLENVQIDVFYKRSCNKNILIYTCFTNEYGQFVARNLVPGCYLLKASSSTYKTKTYSLKVACYNDLINFKIYLEKKCLPETGCIYGLITDNLNEKVAYADVILYKVDESTVKEKVAESASNLIPIAFTKADKNGIYHFYQVPIGTYLIKATKFLNS